LPRSLSGAPLLSRCLQDCGGYTKLCEAIQNTGANTHTTRLGPKTTHIILSAEYENDDKSQAWINDIADKAPNAEVIREKNLKSAF
jgi:hypothetical protein